VVGRLADRHGIRVQLRPAHEEQGTTALVMLPQTITDRPANEEPDAATMALVAFVDSPFTKDAPHTSETWNTQPS